MPKEDEALLEEEQELEEGQEEAKPKKKRKPKPKTGASARILEEPAAKIRGLVSRTDSIMSVRSNAWRRYRAKYRAGLNYLAGVSQPDAFIVNYIYSTIESVKANIAKSMPKITVEGGADGDEMAADLLTRILNTSLNQGGLPKAVKKVAHHGSIAGYAWFKMWFDPDAANGDGDNVIEALPPEDVLVDPLAVPFYRHDGKTNARYIIHRRRDVSLDEIVATYNVSPEDLIDGGAKSMDGIDLEYNGEVSSSTEVKPYGEPRNTLGKTYDVYESWFRTFEPYEEDEEGNVVTSPWYIITVAGNATLKKEYSPYKHSNAPFYPWFDGEDDGAADFYHVGIGEVEEIEMLQDKAALLDVQIYRNIRMTVNRQRVVNRLLGITKSNVTNREGHVYEVSGDPRLALMWDTPPQLGTDVYTYRQQAELAIQNVSGITDVMGGRKPTGIAAAKAVNSLYAASQVRILEKQENLIQTVKLVAQDALENIFQFYDTERLVRLVDGPAVTIIGTYPPELQAGYQPPMPEAGIDPATGMPTAMPDIPPAPLEDGEELEAIREQWRLDNGIDLVLEDVELYKDVKVGHGSPLPEDKGEMGSLALDMFRIGLIDRKAALDVLEWPDRAEIVARMNAMETGPQASANAQSQAGMQEQILQMMMQAQQGGGMGGMV